MRFVPKRDAMYEVRRLPKVQGSVRSVCEKIAHACGAGYEWSDQQGEKRPQGRWRGVVRPRSWAAKRDNASNNTLVQELNRARL